MSRTIRITNQIVRAAFIVLLLAINGVAHAQEHIDRLDVLIAEALQNNPQIKADYERWQAARHKSKQVRSLDDPMAGVTLPGEHVETRLGPQERKYSFSQKVPFPGKLNLRGAAQNKQAQILEQKYEATRREIIRELKFLFYDLYWVDTALLITEQEKGLIESLENVARRKYESNLVAQTDVIKAQVEISKLIEKVEMLKQNRKALTAKLNKVLARDEGSEVAVVTDIKEVPFTYELDRLFEIADSSKQELVSAELAVKKAQYERSLARMDYLPDFTFGVEYIEIGEGTTTMADDGRDAWMGMISVNVPIWFDRLAAKQKESQANLNAAQRMQEDVGNSIYADIQDLYYKVKTYADIVNLYRNALVPQAEQAFDAGQSAYESGKTEFLNWLDSERTLLQTRLAYYKSIADYHKSIAFLERIVGRDL